ncbi:DUF4349 domain-containing protein [Actinomadura sp. 6N118]|uniref:DUF4349 domain-containing protein n=1 Tax=Actinomadura sp. 6N118 TaxID=3375151 RepID=UPI0037BA7DCA
MQTVRRVRYALCAVVVLLLTGGLLAGCSGDDRAGSGSPARNPAPREAVASGAPGVSGGAADSSGAQKQRMNGANPAKLEPYPDGRSVIYQSDLRVRAQNVEAATARAKQLVTAAGGYVDNESSASEPVGATITFKIPADRYPAVLDQLAGQLGTKLSLRQRAEDVTGEVADVDSRVRSAQATLSSFRKLLDKARTVGEVMNVEQEISQRQADLEALQARQKSLQQRTRFATVTLAVEAPKEGQKVGKSREGFLGGLQGGWDAFTAFISGFLLVLGWLLPFLIPLGLLAAGALAVRHRMKRDHMPTPPASE